MKNLNNEDGMILLTVLILMFIATLLGVISINSSTIEVQISGNEKLVATSFAAAEAGLAVAIPIIEKTHYDSTGSVSPASFTVFDGAADVPAEIDSDLYNDITNPDYSRPNDGDATDNHPDIYIADLGGLGVELSIDIDRLYSEAVGGGALEFAMGYEGVGTGAAGGGVVVYYMINSAGKK